MKIRVVIVTFALVMAAIQQSHGLGQIINMTHTLGEDMPVFPEFPPVNITPLMHGYYGNVWLEINVISMCEHSGTHMDAPAHFSRNNLHLHEIPLERLIGPGVVIRVVEEVKKNPDYALEVKDILNWEARHGTIPDGAIVLMDSGWTHNVPNHEAMVGTFDVDNPAEYRFPSISAAAARFIVNHRKQVSVVGVDTLSLDRTTDPAFPAHTTLLGAGIIGLENVANLHLVPEAGATIYCMPIKLYDGSGAPMRMFAIVNDDVMVPNGAGYTSPRLMVSIGIIFVYFLLNYMHN